MKELEINVREAIISDTDEINLVCESAIKTLRKTYRPKESLIKKSLETLPVQKRLVAVFEGKIRGTLKYYDSLDRICLLGLGVHEDYRKIGIAKALISYAESIAKKLNKKLISCHTIKETGNMSFFESCGFSLVNEEISDDFESDCFENLTDLLFGKKLQLGDSNGVN